ncbi:hypothetical protein V8C35DRAFT_295307 [Trichoderma chlorosporum]
MSDTLSPTASTQAATTTNPNTPRPSGSAIGDLQHDITFNAEVASLSPSNLSRRRDDILPTWPDRIDRTKIRALACWQDQSINISMDIHSARQHNSALFKLHTGLRLEGMPNTPRNGLVKAIIFIYPERIHRLSFTAQPQHKPLGASTVGLTFVLNRPPALVLPKTYTGFGPGAERALHSLHNFIQQSSFTIYASFSRKRLPISWWDQLCTNIAEHRVKTITSLTNIQILYQHHGGQVVEGDSLLETAIDRDNATAPSLSACQVADPSTDPAHPAKRKMSTDESSIIGQTRQSTDTVIGIADAKAAHKRELEDMFSALKRSIEDMVNEKLTAHAHEVTRKVEALLAEKDDDLSCRIEEEVSNEMEGVMEHVLEQLTSMPVQTYFTFPTHPYL